jgi:hypothetical protein
LSIVPIDWESFSVVDPWSFKPDAGTAIVMTSIAAMVTLDIILSRNHCSGAYSTASNAITQIDRALKIPSPEESGR